MLAGEFASGGAICAHELRVTAEATFGEPPTVRADSKPVLETGADADGIGHEPREVRS